MRVIAGRFRGHPLRAPRGHQTRPTSDRVREALFASLFDVAGLRVLDLFSGTGALGIEALSRGAESVLFVERARPAQSALLSNLKALKLTPPEARLFSGSIQSALAQQASTSFDLILADPPYDEAPKLAESLYAAASRLLAREGRFVLEYGSKQPVPPLSEALAADLALQKEKAYGECTLASYLKLR